MKREWSWRRELAVAVAGAVLGLAFAPLLVVLPVQAQDVWVLPRNTPRQTPSSQDLPPQDMPPVDLRNMLKPGGKADTTSVDDLLYSSPMGAPPARHGVMPEQPGVYIADHPIFQEQPELPSVPEPDRKIAPKDQAVKGLLFP